MDELKTKAFMDEICDYVQLGDHNLNKLDIDILCIIIRKLEEGLEEQRKRNKEQ